MEVWTVALRSSAVQLVPTFSGSGINAHESVQTGLQVASALF